MLKSLKSFAVFSVLIALFFALSGSAVAQNKTVIWERHDVELTVNTDGTMHVKETQEISFLTGTFTEGYVYRLKANTEDLRDFVVYEPNQPYSEGQGGDYTYHVIDRGNSYEIVWNFPEERNSTRTYVMEYIVDGPVRQYDTGDVLSWFAIPDDHAFPIEESTITVYLPEGTEYIREPEIESANRAFWETSEDNRTATITVAGPIQAYDGVNIRVGFAHGAITAPEPSWQAAVDEQIAADAARARVQPFYDFGAGIIGLLGAIFGPLGVYLLWFLRGKDPDPGPIPDYLTEPPSDLAPGLAGVLIDETADMHDITAILVDFARRGFVEIVEEQRSGAFNSIKRTFVFKKRIEPTAENSAQYERDLFKNFFLRKNERSISKTLPRTFHTTLPAVKSAMYADVTKQGLFQGAPDKVKSRYLTLGSVGIFVSVVFLILTTTALSGFTSFAVCLGIGPILFSLAMLVMARYMPVKTEAGSREAAKWNAFKTYLQNIDKYSDLEHITDKFEEYLPYAIAFGIERRWIHVFSEIPTTPTPRWYRPIWVGGGRPYGRGVYMPGAGRPSVGGGRREEGGGGGIPSLDEIGMGMAGGLNSLGDGMVAALNTMGRTISTPPAPPPGSGSSSTYRGGGSSGWGGGGGFSGGGGGFSGGGGGGGFR